MCVCVCVFVTPWTVAPQALLTLGLFPSKNTGMVCHSLLQGIFPTQGSNTGFPHCSQILYHLSLEGSPISFRIDRFDLLASLRTPIRAMYMSTKYFSKIKDRYILNIKCNVFGNEKDCWHIYTVL